MDVLLATFLAAALAETGDKTQLLVMALAARYGRTGPILLGLVLAALAGSLAAAFAGAWIHDLITPRATALLVAVALVFAGVSGLIGGQRPEVGLHWKTGALITAAASIFIVELGDKTQLLTAALAAQFDSLFLAAAGATAGIVAANVPAALLGERLATAPLRQARIGISVLFLVASFIVAVMSLELI